MKKQFLTRLIPPTAAQLIFVVAVCSVPFLTVFAADQPISLSVSETVRYAPGKLKHGVKNALSPSEGSTVVRIIDILVTNKTDQRVEVTLEYAMFAIDSKKALRPLAITNSKDSKSGQVIALNPREDRLVHVEAKHTGEFGLAGQMVFGKPRDLGQVVEPGIGITTANSNNRGSSTVQNGPALTVFRPAPVIPAPSPARRLGQPDPTMGSNKNPSPAVERYYGCSVVAYVEGRIVARVDKNPAQLPNFGIGTAKDAPAKPRR